MVTTQSKGEKEHEDKVTMQAARDNKIWRQESKGEINGQQNRTGIYMAKLQVSACASRLLWLVDAHNFRCCTLRRRCHRMG